jgi:hypothetical protein
MIQSPAGESMLANAHTLSYDYAMLGDGLIPAELAKVKVPTLTLAPRAASDTARALADLIPNAIPPHEGIGSGSNLEDFFT